MDYSQAYLFLKDLANVLSFYLLLHELAKLYYKLYFQKNLDHFMKPSSFPMKLCIYICNSITLIISE